MFSIVELKTAILDYGISISPMHMLLMYLLMLLVPMIPYLFLYLSLRDEESSAPKAARAARMREFTTRWLHIHRHPELLHH